ncbi:MAG: patatin-like phospholipase family protein [Candidatus Promineifilaceae bacterium]|nr:patatin-like phospholipase family protein [Candidatus Promineifilaceae bacterium]
MIFDMVFEGGGAKGIVFVGALQVFQEKGHTFDRLIGTSAGAITATTLAAGYSNEEMMAALNERVNGRPIFTTFMGDPPPFDEEHIKQSAIRELLRSMDLPLVPDFVEDKLDDQLAKTIATNPALRHVYSFIERGGWYSAHDFVAWLKRKLDEGMYRGRPRNFSEMTMAEMFAATETELTLTGSDTTSGRLLIFNHRTAPDLPLVWAVRMSMSVPLLWQEVIWQEEWGLYRGKSITGHAIVDGGLLSNFPIELFISDEKPVTDVMGEKHSENIIGFLIDETLEVAGAPALGGSSTLTALGSLRTVTRIGQLVNTVTQARDKMVIDTFSDLVVHLPAKGYGTTEFDMSDERREALVVAGRAAAESYLSAPDGVMAAPKELDLEEMEHAAAEANRIAFGILGE